MFPGEYCHMEEKAGSQVLQCTWGRQSRNFLTDYDFLAGWGLEKEKEKVLQAFEDVIIPLDLK